MVQPTMINRLVGALSRRGGTMASPGWGGGQTNWLPRAPNFPGNPSTIASPPSGGDRSVSFDVPHGGGVYGGPTPIGNPPPPTMTNPEPAPFPPTMTQPQPPVASPIGRPPQPIMGDPGGSVGGPYVPGGGIPQPGQMPGAMGIGFSGGGQAMPGNPGQPRPPVFRGSPVTNWPTRVGPGGPPMRRPPIGL